MILSNSGYNVYDVKKKRKKEKKKRRRKEIKGIDINRNFK
jgi:capsid protein